MRTEAAIVFALGVVCGTYAVPPPYSCFDPPGENQTNPLGEGYEDIVEEECCEALIDEGDIAEGRLVFWDPASCYHGPGEFPVAEEVLCRAHDTDGCRFCVESCFGVDGSCITCEDIAADVTAAPTMSPRDYSLFAPTAIAQTPMPTVGTLAPYDAFSGTMEPAMSPPTWTAAPTMGEEEREEECSCMDNISAVERDVLMRRAKTLRCDPSCSDDTDKTWGVINCNFFDLGKDCRACSEICEEDGNGLWFDQFGIICKPCSAIP